MNDEDMEQLVGAARLYATGGDMERYKMLAGLKWLVATCEDLDAIAEEQADG
jgi:hypothetical protein